MHKNDVYFSNYSTILAFFYIVTALRASQSNSLMRGNHFLIKLHTAHTLAKPFFVLQQLKSIFLYSQWNTWLLVCERGCSQWQIHAELSSHSAVSHHAKFSRLFWFSSLQLLFWFKLTTHSHQYHLFSDLKCFKNTLHTNQNQMTNRQS